MKMETIERSWDKNKDGEQDGNDEVWRPMTGLGVFRAWIIGVIIAWAMQLLIVFTVAATSFPERTTKPLRFSIEHWQKDDVCQDSDHSDGTNYTFHFKYDYTLPELVVAQYESARDFGIKLYRKAF